ncbi:hypothetical protein PR202_ga18069 [Eleusine coracana subsp. coracana]|uniref:Transcription elongation factor 1 homolog n=1 Tax=Eleusine coracana subsp. coracana TaxID=191504 RepID=A0AAV5CS42_ELECO|nr:hypothetical protein QOZ80_6AG0509860 [Eleusine coracana subsp. coracana]GJN00848.1 hypothetical protein PR202_ga18069 [Eleusine coracana subsp. coracana]
MGKRKSRMSKLLAQPKKQPKLDTTFPCPFCNHRDSVDCFIDLKHNRARVVCFICRENFSTKAHPLTEPVDVYAEWIDACVAVNQQDDVV